MAENSAEEAPEWAKREIAEAVRILKEDGAHIHRTYAAFMASQTQESTDNTDGGDDTEGKAPPVKKTGKTEPPVKKGVWWAGRNNDE